MGKYGEYMPNDTPGGVVTKNSSQARKKAIFLTKKY
jgi:hypothetical protein